MADDLSVPNFTSMFASAYESGRAMAKSKGVQNALSMAPTDPVGAQGALMRYGAFDEANALGKVADHQRADALRTKAAPMVQSGDYQGAEQTYAAGGDFDTAAAIGKMDETQRAHALDNAQTLAGIGYRLQDVPDINDRRAALNNAADFLKTRGFTQDQIDKVDLSDAGLQGIIGQALTLKDQLEAHRQDQTATETHRHNLATEAMGGVHTVTDGDGTQHLVQVGGGGGGGSVGGGSTPAPSGGPAVPLADMQQHVRQLVPGVQITSGLRSAAHNREVGGAPNSYHLKGEALDLVPPPGMSMQQLHDKLAASGVPFRELLNEGDHVHIAWTGGGHAPASAAAPAAQQPAVRELYTGTPKPQDSGEGTGPLTPEAMENAALKYNSTGQLPTGMGKSAVALRASIMNRAAVLAAADGTTDGGVLRQSIVKGAQQSLNQTMKQHAAVRTYAETANKLGDLVLSLSARGGGQTNVPVVNRWLQAGRKQVQGDRDVTAFDSAISGFSEDFAKVMTGSTGSSAATDSARSAAYDRLSKYATQGQLAAGIATMRKEMVAKDASMSDEEDRNKELIRSGGKSGVAAAADPASPAVKAAIPQAAMTAYQAFHATRAFNKSAPRGSKANPFIAVDAATLKALENTHKGAWAFDPDGNFGQFQ